MIKRNVALLLVLGIVLGGGALAVAQGQPERPTTEPEKAQPPGEQLEGPKGRHGRGRDGGRKGGGGQLRRAVHGELVVPAEGGAFEKVTFDRGRVSQSSDGGRIVIDRPDGQQVSLALTPETRYRGIQDANQVRKGANAMVTSRDGRALTVTQRDPGKTAPGTGNKQGGPGVPFD